jgi:hypothetical protein
MMQALVLSGVANGVGALTATVFLYWIEHYFVLGSDFSPTLELILLGPLVLIAMARTGKPSAARPAPAGTAPSTPAAAPAPAAAAPPAK